MSIILRGINFGSVFTASGTLNFHGQGWPYRKYYRFIPGFDFAGATLITKTTTIDFRLGHMPLDDELQPKEFHPKCIYADFWKGIALNAVDLSGPGAQRLLDIGLWQKIDKPFFISFMAVGDTKAQRMEELGRFCRLLNLYEFRAKFGLEINLSCPNTQHNPQDLIAEAAEMVRLADSLLIVENIPIIIKISVLIDPLTIKQIIAESDCDAVDVSNTIHHGQLPDKIDWEGLFESEISPLQKYGGGGLSGKPLLPLVEAWIKNARRCGIETPIIGGGGILCKKDAAIIKLAGADAISIGTMAMLRPWRVQGLINYANRIYQGGA